MEKYGKIIEKLEKYRKNIRKHIGNVLKSRTSKIIGTVNGTLKIKIYKKYEKEKFG